MFAVHIFLHIFLFISLKSLEIGNAKNCTCVPRDQCLSNEQVGAGLLDLRILEKEPCPPSQNCCNNSMILLPTPTEKRKSGCGYHASRLYPWATNLILKQNQTKLIKCESSLINKKAVITAAHCLEQEGDWSIRIGNIVRSVTKTIIHPLYNEATLHNDIAILLLGTSVPNSRKTGTICIPPRGTILDRSNCSVGFWARNTINKTQTLVKLPSQIVPKDRCVKQLRSTRLGSLFQLHHSFLCAQSPTKDCLALGGSALVCNIPGQPGRFHQAGMVSWGIGCEDDSIPSAYVKLSQFRDWIDEEMLRNGLDLNSYRY